MYIILKNKLNMDEFKKQFIDRDAIINLIFFNNKTKLLDLLEKNKDSENLYVIYFMNDKIEQLTPIITVTDKFLLFLKNILNTEKYEKVNSIKVNLSKLTDGIYYYKEYDDVSFEFLNPYIKIVTIII